MCNHLFVTTRPECVDCNWHVRRTCAWCQKVAYNMHRYSVDFTVASGTVSGATSTTSTTRKDPQMANFAFDRGTAVWISGTNRDDYSAVVLEDTGESEKVKVSITARNDKAATGTITVHVDRALLRFMWQRH